MGLNRELGNQCKKKTVELMVTVILIVTCGLESSSKAKVKTGGTRNRKKTTELLLIRRLTIKGPTKFSYKGRQETENVQDILQSHEVHHRSNQKLERGTYRKRKTFCRG